MSTETCPKIAKCEMYTVWKFRVKSLMAELNVREVVDNDISDMITDKWGKND